MFKVICLILMLFALSTSCLAEQRHVAVVGDSLTSSSGFSPICPEGCSELPMLDVKWVEQFARLRPEWLVTNHAIAGMPLWASGFLPHCKQQAVAALATGATDLVIACGSNDLIMGASASIVFQRILDVVTVWTTGGGDPNRVWVATIPLAFVPNLSCSSDFTFINSSAAVVNASILAHGPFFDRVIRRDLLAAEDMRWSACYNLTGTTYDLNTCECFDGLHGGDGRPWDPTDGMHAKWARQLMEALSPDACN